ncbi:FtsX-like permease family protein [Chitinophaga cymbidii]|uniref:ABC3 transporter permease protein domain-containing protein n=1 Tax=Chitinophaga cymbidii TaxID=1096750 RepID=A0A512RGV0_9BACT|nr:ABC transporter permease [Chitinophaga cymbidii]GEP94922.1 hypothetical protein CCY01nite_11820 [Chitinophaga cymbidii]
MILRIAFKNLLHKPLYATLCWLLLACSTAVLLMLIALSRQAKEQLEKQIEGVDLVLGAKGSPLQLILSSVYNLDAPTGNIYLQEAQRFMQHPMVESAIPLSLGDSYKGYRILGTTPAYLDRFKVQPREGRIFSGSMEVVIGATVAERAGLKIGSRFAGTHGLEEKGHVHEEHSYVVVGVLPATGLAIDQLILTPLESVWTIHEPAKHLEDEDSEHDHEKDNAVQEHDHGTDDDDAHKHDHEKADDRTNSAAGEHHHATDSHPEDDHSDADRQNAADAHDHEDDHQEPADHDQHQNAVPANGHVAATAANKQITAVLIHFRSPLAQLQFPRMINENTNMQAAVPAIEVNRLQSLMGSGAEVLRILGWLLAGLAACSIFVMLVQGTHERRYELALLRSMGSGRGKLLGLVLSEALILALAGILGGFLLSRLSLWLLQQEVFTNYHLTFSGLWKITATDMITAAAILAACLLAALFPAIRAFRLNISKTLANA